MPMGWELFATIAHMVTILDYGAGNLTSVCLAFERLGVEPRVIADAGAYTGGRIVFPGVGAAGSGRTGVQARGFDGLLRRAVAGGIPTLGVCLGMQLLATTSEEDGGVAGLNLISGTVRKFEAQSLATDTLPHSELSPRAVKIPHMGWNTVAHGGHPVFDGIAQNEAFYYVHSYYMQTAAQGDTVATTEYCGVTFAAAIGHGSLVATQFHPERSGEAGARLLRNFLSWEGVCS